MNIFYSDSEKSFYDLQLNYPILPDDLIEITNDQHEYFINAINNKNKEIVVENGQLILVDRVPVYTWNFIRQKRNKMLLQCDYTQLADWVGDKTIWAEYRQALRDIPSTFSDPNQVVWPKAPNT
jgi:hypothetical protein